MQLSYLYMRLTSFPCGFPCVSLYFPCFPYNRQIRRGKNRKPQSSYIIFAMLSERGGRRRM